MNAHLPPALVEVARTHRDYDPDDRMAAGIRRSRRLLAAVGLVAFVGLVLVPIGGAVVAPGTVGVESRVKRIAHPTGGVVARILVANGDHVERDAPLVQLDNGVSGAENLYSTLTVAQMQAQRARLDAERMGAASLTFPPDLLANRDPGARAAMAGERRLFQTRNTELTQTRAQLQARIVEYGKQINGFEAQITALRQQQALIAPEREGVRTLWDKGLVTIARLNQLERTAVDMDGNIASLRSQIAQAEARISETREQILTLDQTRRAEAGTQYATLSNTINEQQVRRTAATEADRRSLVRAPYAGIVDKLALTATGDVIRPGEPFLEIVPDHDRLTIEVMVSPNDIDQVHTGQEARIKFTAFNSTATPEISGRVSYVAPERSTNAETKASFYEARVEIDPAALKRSGIPALKPGMPAEAFIATGTRPMISYLTKPLRDQLERAFRDN
jgi:HlyD family secretion protein